MKIMGHTQSHSLKMFIINEINIINYKDYLVIMYE